MATTKKKTKKRPIPKAATLRKEFVLCGKKGCSKPHGPYWFAFWRDGDKMRKRYIGKKIPSTLRTQANRRVTIGTERKPQRKKQATHLRGWGMRAHEKAKRRKK